MKDLQAHRGPKQDSWNLKPSQLVARENFQRLLAIETHLFLCKHKSMYSWSMIYFYTCVQISQRETVFCRNTQMPKFYFNALNTSLTKKHKPTLRKLHVFFLLSSLINAFGRGERQTLLGSVCRKEGSGDIHQGISKPKTMPTELLNEHVSALHHQLPCCNT